MRWVVFFMMLLCVGSVFWGVTGGTETAFGRVQVENTATQNQNPPPPGFFQSGSTITLKDDGTFKDANGGIYSFKRNDNIVTTEFQPPGGLTWTVTRTGDKNTYTINQNGQTISFTQGSNRITVDGQTYAKKLFGGWNCVSCSDDSTQLDDKVLDNIFTGTIEPLREHQTKEMKETNPRWSDFFRNENQFGESAGLGKTFNQVAGFMEMLGKMRSTLDAYTAYDRLFLGDSLNSWQMNVQDIFGGLTSAGWARRICESKFSMPPNQVAVAELPPGGVAITATVAGECGPIVEDYFGGSQRLYRLLVYVNNPRVQNQQVGQEQQDIRFTASITSDGESIPLFEEMQRVPPGETFTLSGENAIVFYSNASISEICIRLENPPPFFAGSDRFCNRITCD